MLRQTDYHVTIVPRKDVSILTVYVLKQKKETTT